MGKRTEPESESWPPDATRRDRGSFCDLTFVASMMMLELLPIAERGYEHYD
jgi:hypothetical protein